MPGLQLTSFLSYKGKTNKGGGGKIIDFVDFFDTFLNVFYNNMKVFVE